MIRKLKMSTFKYKTLLGKLQEMAREFILTRTSFYGLSNVFKTKFVIMRIFWSLVVISFVSFTIEGIVDSITKYFEFQVFTKIEIIHESVSLFPAVTICNVNPFFAKFADNYFETILKKNNLTLAQLNSKDWRKLDDIKLFFYKKEAFEQISGYEIDEIILRCTFNTIDCDLGADFNLVYVQNYGNCFRFNAIKNHSKSKTLSRIGSLYGLQLDLFVGYNKTSYTKYFGQGAHVFIHDQSENASDGFDVSVGFRTNIGIKRLFVEKKEYPYSYCQKGDKTNNEFIFVSKIIEWNNVYKQVDCFDICIEDYKLKQCNCTCYAIANNRSARDNIRGKSRCQGQTEKNCFDAFTEKLNISTWENINCTKECPNECDSVQFQMTTNQIDYLSDELADLMNQDPIIKGKFDNSTKISYDHLKKSLVSLNIYYDELGYTIIKEIPQTSIINSLSSIGGIIGLFLGTSFISFFEIFELLFLISKEIFDHLKIKKRPIQVVI